MNHEWKGGMTASTPDNPPEGYSYCENCGAEENDDNRDEECAPPLEQVSFHQAVYDDSTLDSELKIGWLKMCADQYLEELGEHERAVNILRSTLNVVEQLCAEGKAYMVPEACGIALRATVLRRGPDRKAEAR